VIATVDVPPGAISLDAYHAVTARTLDGVLDALEELADSVPTAQIDVECAVRCARAAVRCLARSRRAMPACGAPRIATYRRVH